MSKNKQKKSIYNKMNKTFFFLNLIIINEFKKK